MFTKEMILKKTKRLAAKNKVQKELYIKKYKKYAKEAKTPEDKEYYLRQIEKFKVEMHNTSNLWPIKYFKKLHVFKASNVSFNPESLKAYSYDWWLFVSLIKGKLVFNDFGYSSSTRKHQNKVASLLSALGLKIDLEIEAPGGLQSLDEAISYYEGIIKVLSMAIANPRSKQKTNESRVLRIKECQKKIQQIKELL